MTKDERFETILQMNITPGAKIYLVTLYYYGEPMTVKNMNDYLCKSLTYKNLETSLKDLIDKNIVLKTSKIVNGIKRKAFEINNELLGEDVLNE